MEELEEASEWTQQDTENLQDYLRTIQIQLLSNGIYVVSETKEYDVGSKKAIVRGTHIRSVTFEKDERMSQYFLPDGRTALMLVFRAGNEYISQQRFFFLTSMGQGLDGIVEGDEWKMKAGLVKPQQDLRQIPRRMAVESGIGAVDDIQDFHDQMKNYIGSVVFLPLTKAKTMQGLGFLERIEAHHRFYESIKDEL